MHLLKNQMMPPCSDEFPGVLHSAVGGPGRFLSISFTKLSASGAMSWHRVMGGFIGMG